HTSLLLLLHLQPPPPPSTLFPYTTLFRSQLTNILRDVRTDAERGRIYLPQSELARFKVTEREILNFEYSDRFRALAESVAARARDRKSTRLNSSHVAISYAVFCLKKKNI